MGKYLLILIVFLLFMLLLAMARVRVYLHYSRVGKDDHMAMEVSTLSGVLRYRLVLPFVRLERKRNRLVLIVKALLGRGRKKAGEKKDFAVPGPLGSLKLLQVALALLKKYAPACVYLLRRTQIRKFCWHTEIGTGDPFYTGLATGAARSLKGIILGVLYRHVPPGAARPEMAVRPDFVNPCFKTSFECIFEIKVGHAALSGIKALVIRLKTADDLTPG